MISLYWAKKALATTPSNSPKSASETTTARHWNGKEWVTVEFKQGDLRYRKGKFYSYEKAFRYTEEGKRVCAYKQSNKK